MRHDFEIEGKHVVGESQWVGNQLWIHLNGKTFSVENREQQKRRGAAATGKTGDLAAPMPGKITKVLKKSGDTVTQGEVVLVMEAMKMEYTIKSEGPGVIDAVLCQVGDQVTLGKVLVKISPGT